jgi:glycosyltransferase involved in cell wall biosynthesis
LNENVKSYDLKEGDKVIVEILKDENQNLIATVQDVSRSTPILICFIMLLILILSIGNKNGIKTIVLEHGTSHLSVHIKPVDYLGAKYEHNLTKRGLRFSPKYYGVSKAANEWLEHFNIKASGVLYNAIDMGEVEAMQKKHVEHYREKYDIPKDATIVTFTGRMVEEKGVPQLLDAAENILKDRDDVFFFLAGNGKLLAEAENRTKDNRNIICLGRVDAEHIISLLDESNIFCLPSFSEGFSTSILEAAACKAYIITTYRGGSKELVSSPRYGMIIPDYRLEYVERALRGAIADSEGCRQAAEDCYNRLVENFTWKQTVESVEKIMSENK